MLTSIVVAQTEGRISGTVKDTGGGVLPGATVEALHQETGQVRRVITDDIGNYVLALMPIGSYRMTAEFPGFTKAEVDNVTLEVTQSRVVDFSLAVAMSNQEVTVVSQATVAVTTTDATLGQMIHAEQVEYLPLNRRNFVQLALLGPGTSAGRQGSFLAGGNSSEVSYRGTMSVSAQGMRENANDWLYDGIDNNELTAGGVGIMPSVDSVAEFKVMTYNFEARYGSRGGTTILVSTKSGGNKFHGSVFEYLRHDAMDARNFFDGSEKGSLRRNQYGFSLGGPILKDKMFFFGGFEATNLQEGQTLQATTPTDLMKQGIFTESFPDVTAAVIYDPATTRTDPDTGLLVRDPFPGNVIPKDRIDPIATALLGFLPAPTRTDRLGNNYLSNPDKTLDDYMFYGRLDHEFSEKDRLFFRLAIEDGDQFQPDSGPGYASTGSCNSNQNFHTDGLNIAASYTHIFTPSTINQFTGGWNKVFNFITSYGYLSNKSEELGIPGSNLGTDETSSLLKIGLSDYIGCGDRCYSPFQGGTNVFHFSDTMTLVRGNHTFNLGGVTRAMQMNQLGDWMPAGQFSFTPNFTAGFTSSGSLDPNTGSSVASLLLGLPSSGSRTNMLNGWLTGRRWKEYRGFIDDNWKVRPSLTFTLGLAYVVTTPQTEAADRMSNFDFYTGEIFVGGQIGVKTDYSNIQPRFGFAWSPGGNTKMVLRGGYGIFHDYSAQGGAQGPVQNPPFSNYYTFSTDNITPIRTLATGFPENNIPIKPEEHTGNWTAVNPDFKAGVIQQWNLNIERSLPGTMVFMASYAGTRGSHLFNRGRNLNSATPGPGYNPAERRPYPNIDGINTTISRSWLDYHSMQLRLERRAAEGGYLLASYTFSKGLTDGQSGLGGDPGTVYFPFDPWKNADKAANNTDLRHSFKLSYVYDLPFGSSLTGVSRALLFGWNFNAILVAHTGYPLAMQMRSNTNGTANGNRPNRVGDGTLENPTVEKWFDTSAYVAPPVGEFGDAARTTTYGPGRWNLDIAAAKKIDVSETSQLSFRVEVFNAFNHAQFQTPNTSIGGFTAGSISSTVMTSRQVQLAVRFVF